jgi:hypothetical protein
MNEINEENSLNCNAVDRVPSRASAGCATWPPPWLSGLEQTQPLSSPPETPATESVPEPSPPPDPWILWDAVSWPERCLESERRFGQRQARLYPLIQVRRGDRMFCSGRVQTTRGPGVLLSILADQAAVALDAGPKGKVVLLKPWEVWPVPGWGGT